MRRLAIRCLLSDKVRESRLTLLEALDLPQVKTREMKQILHALDADSSVLLVTSEVDETVVRAASNLQRVKTLPAPNLNVVDLLDHDQLIMTVGAVRKAEELWAGGTTSAELVADPGQGSADKPKKEAEESPTDQGSVNKGKV